MTENTYTGPAIIDQLPEQIRLTRAQKKTSIEYKSLGKPNTYMRRCKTVKTEKIDGVFYTTYLHFTKGIKRRRVVTNTIKPLYMAV